MVNNYKLEKYIGIQQSITNYFPNSISLSKSVKKYLFKQYFNLSIKKMYFIY